MSSLNNFKNQESIVDEFGRDPTLRSSKARIEYERSVKDMIDFCKSYYAGKSWADIEWEEDEKEKEKEKEKCKELDLKRKKLWIWEAYELEEGEVFE